MAVSSSTAIFLVSLLAIPITYLVNSVQVLHGETGLFFCGTAALLFVSGLVYFSVKNKGHPTDPFLYVLNICAFGGVASLIIALEGDGIIHGFMTEYLRGGEPYLKTAHGTLVSYWDGMGHYALVIMMLSAISWNQSFREVGLYWVGSIGHSMIVFIPGNVVGKYGLRWSFLLNVPYIIFPFICGARFLRERSQGTSSPHIQDNSSQSKSIWRRPLDLFFIVGFVYAIVLSLFRGFAVLDSTHSFLNDYVTNIEPYLKDPVAYGKVQMLVYLFYYTPYYVMAIYGLLYPGCSWMSDWALLHAGAAAQGQVVHIGASFHHRTPYIMRVPPGEVAQVVFWTINIFLLVFPQMFAYRCIRNSEYFDSRTSSSNKALDKKKK